MNGFRAPKRRNQIPADRAGRYAAGTDKPSPIMLSEPQPRSGCGESKHLSLF
jgi:hypothetical protein